MASNVSHREKPDTSGKPFLLTHSEIDLLRQDMRMAREIIRQRLRQDRNLVSPQKPLQPVRQDTLLVSDDRMTNSEIPHHR